MEWLAWKKKELESDGFYRYIANAGVIMVCMRTIIIIMIIISMHNPNPHYQNKQTLLSRGLSSPSLSSTTTPKVFTKGFYGLTISPHSYP
jgi:hypothetical protein